MWDLIYERLSENKKIRKLHIRIKETIETEKLLFVLLCYLFYLFLIDLLVHKFLGFMFV